MEVFNWTRCRMAVSTNCYKSVCLGTGAISVVGRTTLITEAQIKPLLLIKQDVLEVKKIAQAAAYG